MYLLKVGPKVFNVDKVMKAYTGLLFYYILKSALY